MELHKVSEHSNEEDGWQIGCYRLHYTPHTTTTSNKDQNPKRQCGDCDEHQGGEGIEQKLREELPVVETDAIVYPWRVVVHIEMTSITNGAVVTPLWLPRMARLAKPFAEVVF